MEMNILIVGVGGQGTLLASRVLGKYAEYINMDCKLSEVHGMAQRGGSVITHIKIAKKVFSPIVEIGNADILLGFERLETLRSAHYINKQGYIICNNQEIMPMPVITGAMPYPKDIEDNLSKYSKNLAFINALDCAKKAGNIKTVNTVMLSQLCKKLKLDRELFLQAVSESVPQKVRDVNINAFNMGYDL